MLLTLFLFHADSITLREAIDIALAKSPIYHEARLTRDRSRIQFYQNLANLLPTVAVTGAVTRTAIDSLQTTAYTKGLNATMPIFDLEIIGSIAAARAQTAGSQIQFRAEIASLVLRVETAYYNLLNSRELLKSSELAIARAEKNAELVKTRFALGTASRLEALQAEVFHLRSLQDQSRARTLETTAHEELKTLLGTDSPLAVADTVPEPETLVFPDLDSLLDRLPAVNYSVRVAGEMHNIARINLWASYLAFLPRVSVFYGRTLTADSLTFDFQFFNENAAANYGINVALPVFELKGLIFNNLNAHNDLRRKEQARIRAIREAEKALKTSYYALQEQFSRLLFARKSSEAADEAARIAAERYGLGALSLLDLLNIEADGYEARVTYIQSLTDFYVQRANFSYLLGGLLE